MIDLSGIEYNFLPGLLWWLVPVAIAAAFLWWVFTTYGEDRNLWTALGAIVLLVGGVWTLTGWAIMLGVVPSSYVEAEKERMIVEQLESQGFANVDLDSGRKFTASVDGQYFRGALVHDSEYRYQIVELSVD